VQSRIDDGYTPLASDKLSNSEPTTPPCEGWRERLNRLSDKEGGKLWWGITAVLAGLELSNAIIGPMLMAYSPLSRFPLVGAIFLLVAVWTFIAWVGVTIWASYKWPKAF